MSFSCHALFTLMCGSLLAGIGFAAMNTDSLAYQTLRTTAMGCDSTNQVFSSADALAAAGLYTDAIQLLREFVHPADTSRQCAAPRSLQKSYASWTITSGSDYNHIEDADTIAKTPEQIRDYKRLTETPLSLWARARSSLHPENACCETITPEVYISERKGRLETAARFSRAAGTVRIEPSVKAEKWFRTDASGVADFSPFRTQPSDMSGAALRLSLSDPYTSRTISSSAIPLVVDWEHYRHDQSGYESFISYRLSPSIELSPGLLPLDLRFSAQTEYRNYYRAQSDYLDIVSTGADIEASIHSGNRSGRLHCAWSGDRYLNYEKSQANERLPAAIDRFDILFRGVHSGTGTVNGRLSARGMYGNECYQASDGHDTAALWGVEVSATPGIDVNIISRQCTIGPELFWERRWARQHADLWVWDARNVLEPGIRIAWSSAALDAALLAAYRAENIDPSFATEDSRSFRGNAECTWNVTPAASGYLFIEYQYRMYAPFNRSSRRSENITISANITIRR